MEDTARKQLLIAEIEVMLVTLAERGFNASAVAISTDWTEAELLALRRQLRDTLRTLGGGK